MARTKGSDRVVVAQEVSDREDAMDVDPPAQPRSRTSGATSSSNSQRKPNSSAQQQTSSKTRVTGGGGVASKTKQQPPPTTNVVEVLDDDDDSEDERPVRSTYSAEPKKTAAETAASRAKGKGKEVTAATKPPSTSTQHKINGRASTVENQRSVSGQQEKPSSSSRPSEDEGDWPEITAHYKQQAQQWEAKFKELARIRTTEAEQALVEYTAAAEEQFKALQDAHDLLASQYPLLDHLSERGQNPILNLLTVEATDQRFLDYENRISILDEAILERDKAIVERNKYIDEKEEELQELQREIESLRSDHQVEVEQNHKLNLQLKALRSDAQIVAQAKTLVANNVTPPPRPEPNDEYSEAAQAHDATIRLYEGISNVMVMTCIKLPRPEQQEDDWRFDCAIRHGTEEDLVIEFHLIECDYLNENTGEVERFYHYKPVKTYPIEESLDFFATQFRFPKTQLGQLIIQLLVKLEYTITEDDGVDEEGGDGAESEVAQDTADQSL